jgi:hypothetical protein
VATIKELQLAIKHLLVCGVFILTHAVLLLSHVDIAAPTSLYMPTNPHTLLSMLDMLKTMLCLCYSILIYNGNVIWFYVHILCPDQPGFSHIWMCFHPGSLYSICNIIMYIYLRGFRVYRSVLSILKENVEYLHTFFDAHVCATVHTIRNLSEYNENA